MEFHFKNQYRGNESMLFYDILFKTSNQKNILPVSIL